MQLTQQLSAQIGEPLRKSTVHELVDLLAAQLERTAELADRLTKLEGAKIDDESGPGPSLSG